MPLDNNLRFFFILKVIKSLHNAISKFNIFLLSTFSVKKKNNQTDLFEYIYKWPRHITPDTKAVGFFLNDKIAISIVNLRLGASEWLMTFSLFIYLFNLMRLFMMREMRLSFAWQQVMLT